MIEAAFAQYFRATVLSGETDPNRLHDLKRQLDEAGVYGADEVEAVVALFLAAAPRDRLDPGLDAAAARYRGLDEDGQIAFKGGAKAFIRTYGFLAALLPYAVPGWEKLATFLTLLVPKLPSPAGGELAPDALDAVDMDSYRVEVEAALRIAVPDADAEIEPVPMGAAGQRPEPEIDRLSRVVREFNERFGAIDFRDGDRVVRFMFEEMPRNIAANARVRNAMDAGDTQNARIEHDLAVDDEVTNGMTDHTDLFRRYSAEPGFREWLRASLFAMTSNTRAPPAPSVVQAGQQLARRPNPP